jgi:hypothetical protein
MSFEGVPYRVRRTTARLALFMHALALVGCGGDSRGNAGGRTSGGTSGKAGASGASPGEGGDGGLGGIPGGGASGKTAAGGSSGRGGDGAGGAKAGAAGEGTAGASAGNSTGGRGGKGSGGAGTGGNAGSSEDGGEGGLGGASGEGGETACPPVEYAAPDTCILSPSATTLIDLDDQGWADDSHQCTGGNSSAQMAPQSSVDGRSAREIAWDINGCAYSQVRYTFSAPQDLSNADVFAIDLHGGAPSEVANNIGLLFGDADDVLCRVDLPFDAGGASHGDEASENQIDRWMSNLTISRAAFTNCFDTGGGSDTTIDWSRINRFFLAINRPASHDGPGGGSGRLAFGGLRYDRAAGWPRQAEFASARGERYSCSARQAVAYVMSREVAETGFFISWEGEQTPSAILYDLALVLIALSREGTWDGGVPMNAAARAADRLATRLVTELDDNLNGNGRPYWPRRWNAETGIITDGDPDRPWEGDEAWATMAMLIYSRKSGSEAAAAAAATVASWLANKIDASGHLLGHDLQPTNTESTVAAWWCMVLTDRNDKADAIQAHLLGTERWNSELGHWQRGADDPVIALDAQTWTSSVARHPRVDRDDLALAALSFARRTLASTSRVDGTNLCGFDGMGPVAIWNEGVGQYVSAQGEGADSFLDMLVWQQQQYGNGSLAGSPESRELRSGFGWLTPWRGLAPTLWLYFAVTGMPFPLPRE